MTRLGTSIFLICAPLLVLGCAGEEPLGLSDQVPAPLFARDKAGGSCPTAVDVVVRDEAQLANALATANEGDVIGLDGFIELTSEVVIRTDGITLTCASPGSGLFASAAVAQPIPALVGVFGAADVTVEHLVLDGSTTWLEPYRTGNAASPRLSNNDVVCGRLACAFLRRGTEPEVVDNEFVASAPTLVLGIGVRSTGSALIKGNEITTTAPSTNPFEGGISLQQGANATVVDNEVEGPWANGMAFADQDGMAVANNEIDGAAFNGIRLALVTNSTVEANNVKHSGEVGILALNLPPGSTDNTIRENEIEDSGLESCRDENAGSRTQGTANTWNDNEAEAPSSPLGICDDDN